MTEGKGGGGLTDKQKVRLAELLAKKNLTEKQAEEMQRLIDKDNKPPELSATAKTYCQKWLKEKLYNRRKEIRSKFIEKGNCNELLSLELINAQTMEDYTLNTEYRENDYLTGTCDIEGVECIRDIKNSWSVDTFPLFDYGIKNKDYEWQLQGYMELYDKDFAYLDYTLTDAPLHLIKQEAKAIAYKDGLDYDEIFPEVHRQMTYDDIPQHLKHKSFSLNRSRESIEKVYARVELCRQYINELVKGL